MRCLFWYSSVWPSLPIIILRLICLLLQPFVPFEISLYAFCYPGPFRDPSVCLFFSCFISDLLCMPLFYLFLLEKPQYTSIYLTSFRNSLVIFILRGKLAFTLYARLIMHFKRFNGMSRFNCLNLEMTF